MPNTTETMPPYGSTLPSPVMSPSSEPILQPNPQLGTTSPPGQPVLQPTTPYVQPGQPVYPPTTPYVQPGQPVYPPYELVPAQPVYPPPEYWMPVPSPGLGLVPGDSNPRWDFSVDALWLERDTGVAVPLGFTSFNYGSHAPQAVRTDSLCTDEVLFPLEPGIRLQVIGRITDQMAIEGSGWGLQQWSIGQTIYGDPIGETVLAHSSWLQIPVFDNSLSYSYSSQVANAEINQRFKLFSIDPYRAFSWLWGVRYFYLADDFTLTGADLTSKYESLNWQTKNNLIGMQLGLQWAWGWDRFQLSSEAKIGLFANAYSQQGADLAGGAVGFQPFDVSHSGTDLAALFEVSVLLRYRITPCTWLRAGYQFYGVTGQALGPRQLGGYDAAGTVGFDGLSVGLELTR
ncbi:MAG: hypothetical protein ABSG67_22395 [Thermoguttaceae bacterium]